MTSACRPTARTALRGAEQLRRLEERLDLGGGLLLPRVELLLGAVHPDHRNLQLQARLDVVVVARRHVHPALLGADPALALLEVGGVRLVGADLLRRHHEVEVRLEVPPRLPQQLVVDVGDQPGLELLAEALELRVGLLERGPAHHRVGQEAGARGLERPAELARDLDGRAAQHLRVQLVGARLDLLLGLEEQRYELLARERVAVLVGLLGEGVVDPGLPVDQRPVDVEGDEGDFLGQWHAAVHCDRGAAPLAPARAREYDRGRGTCPRSASCSCSWAPRWWRRRRTCLRTAPSGRPRRSRSRPASACWWPERAWAPRRWSRRA